MAKGGYSNGVSTAKPVVANAGAPVVGANVAWAKGLQVQRLIRVHVQGAHNLTVCRALNTATSPYLGTGGHVAYRTTAKVTCVPCMRATKPAKAPKAAKPKQAPAAPAAPVAATNAA